MVKTELLWSVTDPSDVLVTFTRQLEEVTDGSVQLYDPPDALAITVVHEVPLSEEYSIFTVETLTADHVMDCELPSSQFSPPFGEFTVTDGGR